MTGGPGALRDAAGWVLVAGALLFAARACVIYAGDLRIPNVDLMGASIGFDRSWMTATVVTGIGFPLLLDLAWAWFGAVFLAGFLIRFPVKGWLYRRFRPRAGR